MRIKPFNYRICIAKSNDILCHKDDPEFHINDYKFTELVNPLTRWAADPFLVCDDGKYYLFAELGTKYFENRGYSFGSIAYKRVGVKYPTFWHKCIQSKTHMSFPNVFRQDGEFYMIPESYRSGTVTLYKAVKFPNKWERIKTLINDGYFVDTDIFEFKGETYLLTYRIKCRPFRSELYVLKNGTFELHSTVEDVEGTFRLGGKVRINDGNVYVYTQDSRISYGKGLFLNKLIITEKEHLFERIQSFDCSEFTQFHTTKRTGLHTLNFCDDYCVIDVMYDHKSIYVSFRKLIHIILKPIIKLLVYFKHKFVPKNNQRNCKHGD